MIGLQVRQQALPPCGAARPTRRRSPAATLPSCPPARRRCRWLVLFLFGHMRDFYRKKIWGGREVKKDKEGYAPIRQDYEVRACCPGASGASGVSSQPQGYPPVRGGASQPCDAAGRF
jgi:hypothetical protein